LFPLINACGISFSIADSRNVELLTLLLTVAEKLSSGIKRNKNRQIHKYFKPNDFINAHYNFKVSNT